MIKKLSVILLLLLFTAQLFGKGSREAEPELFAVTHSYDFSFTIDPDLAPRVSDGSIVFSLPVGNRDFVRLSGDFLNWTDQGPLFTRIGDIYQIRYPLPPGKTYRYKFVTSNGWLADPNNPEMVDDGYSSFNSILKLDANGEIIEASPTKVFDRRSDSQHFSLYTQTDFIKNESQVNEMLENCEKIRRELISFVGSSIELNTSDRIEIFYREPTTNNSSGVVVENKMWLTVPEEALWWTVTHELVHILIGTTGVNILDEGAAEAITALQKNSRINSSAKFYFRKIPGELKKRNAFIPLREVLNTRFILSPRVRDLYGESAALVLFLFDTYPREDVLRVIKTGKFVDLGRSIIELENDLLRWSR